MCGNVNKFYPRWTGDGACSRIVYIFRSSGRSQSRIHTRNYKTAARKQNDRYCRSITKYDISAAAILNM